MVFVEKILWDEITKAFQNGLIHFPPKINLVVTRKHPNNNEGQDVTFYN